MLNGKLNKAAITALAVVAIIKCEGHSRLNVDFVSTGAALTGFVIEAQYRPNGPWVPVAANAGSYSTPVSPLLTCSGNLGTSGVGILSYFRLDTQGIFAVRLSASAATAATVDGGFALG